MTFLKITLCVLSLLFIVSCASRASSVSPIAIPSSNYKGLSCDDTKLALEQARSSQNALTNQQNNAATGDAVGVFFVLLPLGSVFGADKEGELAQAKGEVLALQGAVSINCKNEDAAGSVPDNVNGSISVRLEKVRSLLKDGLITQKDADVKRKAILDEM